jgi:hypothetical protein
MAQANPAIDEKVELNCYRIAGIVILLGIIITVIEIRVQLSHGCCFPYPEIGYLFLIGGCLMLGVALFFSMIVGILKIKLKNGRQGDS